MKHLIAFNQYQRDRIKELEDKEVLTPHMQMLADLREEFDRLNINYKHEEKNVSNLSNKQCLSQPDTDKATNNGGSTDYYKLPSKAVDLQDLIEAKEMSFALGNIFKAVYRLGSQTHSSSERDLNKIIYFAERELKRLNKY